jgi:hypothetical protein
MKREKPKAKYINSCSENGTAIIDKIKVLNENRIPASDIHIAESLQSLLMYLDDYSITPLLINAIQNKKNLQEEYDKSCRDLINKALQLRDSGDFVGYRTCISFAYENMEENDDTLIPYEVEKLFEIEQVYYSLLNDGQRELNNSQKADLYKIATAFCQSQYGSAHFLIHNKKWPSMLQDRLQETSEICEQHMRLVVYLRNRDLYCVYENGIKPQLIYKPEWSDKKTAQTRQIVSIGNWLLILVEYHIIDSYSRHTMLPSGKMGYMPRHSRDDLLFFDIRKKQIVRTDFLKSYGHFTTSIIQGGNKGAIDLWTRAMDLYDYHKTIDNGHDWTINLKDNCLHFYSTTTGLTNHLGGTSLVGSYSPETVLNDPDEIQLEKDIAAYLDVSN